MCAFFFSTLQHRFGVDGQHFHMFIYCILLGVLLTSLDAQIVHKIFNFNSSLTETLKVEEQSRAGQNKNKKTVCRQHMSHTMSIAPFFPYSFTHSFIHSIKKAHQMHVYIPQFYHVYTVYMMYKFIRFSSHIINKYIEYSSLINLLTHIHKAPNQVRHFSIHHLRTDSTDMSPTYSTCSY